MAGFLLENFMAKLPRYGAVLQSWIDPEFDDLEGVEEKLRSEFSIKGSIEMGFFDYGEELEEEDTQE